jgi:hypothetical protein
MSRIFDRQSFPAQIGGLFRPRRLVVKLWSASPQSPWELNPNSGQPFRFKSVQMFLILNAVQVATHSVMSSSRDIAHDPISTIKLLEFAPRDRTDKILRRIVRWQSAALFGIGATVRRRTTDAPGRIRIRAVSDRKRRDVARRDDGRHMSLGGAFRLTRVQICFAVPDDPRDASSTEEGNSVQSALLEPQWFAQFNDAAVRAFEPRSADAPFAVHRI